MWEWPLGLVPPCHCPFWQFTYPLLSFCSWYCVTSCAASRGLAKSCSLMCTVGSCTSSDNEGSLNCSVLFLLGIFFLSICFLGSQCSKEQPVYLWLTCSSSWTALGFQQKDWKNKEKDSFNLPGGIVHFSNRDNLKNTRHCANTLVTLKNKIKSFLVGKWMSMLCTFASSSNSETNFAVIDKLLYCFIMGIEALNIPVQARLGLTPKWSFAMYPAGCTQQAEQ